MEAIVEYNYIAREPDELTLRKGDIIREIKVMLGGWWEGTLRDKRGMFPDNFVKVLDPSPTSGASTTEAVSSTKPEEVTLRNGGSGRRWCKVLYSYEPCNEDELTLVPQDSIEFLGEVEEGWWRGRLRGRVGVFPSNFVHLSYEEEDKHKKDKKEYCRVLYAYEAANEDELTLVEGEIIALLSRDAPDKGWWKGELRGQIGLFPDNFVEVIGVKNDHQDQEQWHEASQLTSKSVAKHAHQLKKSEKAHARKSLDPKNLRTDHFSNVETTKKMITSSSSTSSTLALSNVGGGGGSSGGGSGEKKPIGNPSLISNLKHFISDTGSNNGNGNPSIALGEELDGVERGEGAPLSHLTASRAKAPRRRLPSSQHLRHHTTGTTTTATTILNTTINPTMDDNLSNGNTEETDSLREDEGEKLSAKARKKAPWVEELKMNQLERRKVGSVDRVDKPEIKKESTFSRLMLSFRNIDAAAKQETDCEDKQKEKERKSDTTDHGTVTTPGTLAFVPYHLYSQLLERVAMLEEEQALLKQTVQQLSEQLVPLMANASMNNKV
ncbi:SH3 domain-containing kinase-binding protein 1-like isoform X1 [Polistes fuscatus]|uniref:SH3 domain-containing kinase-binding protein 1-like isoform X1 n=1 Tax=Polistes fuscatus TaxID=30207 RepID=UPI001CA8C6FD|nr:SH3 domain-containing kinase-binding protein 1-like isoform X1 [Polistes fuscatus]XP_043489818.1 SH3 domain-containing kinase-binding protein 1-like isoform X1 [Polistes fuscatus]